MGAFSGVYTNWMSLVSHGGTVALRLFPGDWSVGIVVGSLPLRLSVCHPQPSLPLHSTQVEQSKMLIVTVSVPQENQEIEMYLVLQLCWHQTGDSGNSEISKSLEKWKSCGTVVVVATIEAG